MTIQPKTHMLFCRVTLTDKQRFIATCERLGRTQSNVLNALVGEFLKVHEEPVTAKPKRKRVAKRSNGNDC